MRRAGRYYQGYLIGLSGGLTAGATLMYLLDPTGGRRRRARAEERAQHAVHLADHAANIGWRDLGNRTRGLLFDLASLWRRQAASDQVLAERIRARLGHLTTHPHALEATVRNGRVQLRGPVLESEVTRLLHGLAHVPGVRGIDNLLEPHRTGDHIPSLQGAGRLPARQTWKPATRLIGSGLGMGLGLAGLGRRGLFGWGLASAGGLLALRSFAGRRPGLAAGRGRAITLSKTINLDAPLEEVFNAFAGFEGFPRIMSHVKRVERVGDRLWRWTVSGPGGVPFTWDAELTRLVPNQILSWKSVGNPPVRSDGSVRFERNAQGGTRLQIRLGYHPPAGALGHAFARIFGSDPQRLMDDDLQRFKAALESGRFVSAPQPSISTQPPLA